MEVIKDNVSDHYIIETIIQTDAEKHVISNDVPDYTRADHDGMFKDLNKLDWDDLLLEHSAEKAWSIFKNKWKEAEAEHVPLKKKREPKKKPFFNRNVTRLLRKKRRHWRFYKDSGRIDQYLKYKEASDKALEEARLAKEKYEKSIGKGKRNLKSECDC